MELGNCLWFQELKYIITEPNVHLFSFSFPQIIAFALEGKRSKVTRRPKASDYQRLNLKVRKKEPGLGRIQNFSWANSGDAAVLSPSLWKLQTGPSVQCTCIYKVRARRGLSVLSRLTDNRSAWKCDLSVCFCPKFPLKDITSTSCNCIHFKTLFALFQLLTHEHCVKH